MKKKMKAVQTEVAQGSSRRQFLADSMKLALLFGVPVSLQKALAAETQESVVFVFLRGGADGLSMLRPSASGGLQSSHAVLAAARPNLMIQGANALAGSPFEIHPELMRMKALYDSGEAAFVHGAGSPNPTRSHFEQQDLIEFGNPNRVSGVTGGFLNRSLGELAQRSAQLPAVALASGVTVALRGRELALSLPTKLAGFTNLNAPGIVSGLTIDERVANGMRSVPADRSRIDALSNAKGHQAVASLGKVKEAMAKRSQLNIGTDTEYAGLPAFGTAVQLLATDPGLRILTVDVPGWDTHQNMGVNDGPFNNLMIRLDKALGQMADDLKANGQWQRATVVVMSEFGRRVAQNGSAGLDHGRGGVMMTFGGQVKGKKVVTQVPGSSQTWDLRQLEAPGDVRVTVDYRHVFAEMFKKRFNLTSAAIGTEIFPGFSAADLNLFKS